MNGIYDLAIIGGGITGANLAYRMAHFKLNTILLEKQNDFCCGVSKANSGIVHGGFHYSAEKTLKGKLELRGNEMFDNLHRDLGFPFRRCGILVAAFQEDQMDTILKLYQQGVENGVPQIELCGATRIHELEPKLNASACGGLYAPCGGVVEPYVMVFSLIHAAQKNDLSTKTNFEVQSAQWTGEHWDIISADGQTVRAKYAVNAAGLYADDVSRIFGAEDFKIRPRKGEEYMLDRLSAACPSKVIFPVPSAHSKGVLVIPTAGGTTMIGPTAEMVDDKADTKTSEENRTMIFSLAKNMVSGISERDLITSFSGSRPVMEGREDFYIDISKQVPHFVQAAGIQSPGLTASPAIAERIEGLLKQDGLELIPREDFQLPEIKPVIREASAEQADKLHEKDPAWTNIICRCEKVSEAEIRNAIRQGHTTLNSIKLATRAGMGRCQGGFCTLKIMHLIADETGIPLEDVVRLENGSRIAVGHLGESGKEQEQ